LAGDWTTCEENAGQGPAKFIAQQFLPQALILNNIIKYLEHYFTNLPEFFSPFIDNTQI